MTLPWHLGFVEKTPPAPATLIIGQTGAGRDELALALAASFAGGGENPIAAVLTAVKKEGKKEWFADKNADVLAVYPDGGVIPVDAARRVVEFCAISPIFMPRRAVLVASAELLNAAAANALLKVLEEPAADKSLVLSARSASLLPPTVASRCRIIAAPRPDKKQSREWLEQNGGGIASLDFCGGLPLDAARTDAAQIAAAAELFAAGKKLNIHAAAQTMAGFDGWLDCLQKWVSDGARAASGVSARYFPGREKL
ncbi:MAG: hypothetical protein HAW59_02300, partial [Betaproteobacteria bacterium]|nr:hypothetical protein [Betaproteobacteria bacterium]